MTTEDRIERLRELAEKRAKSAGDYLREHGICMRGGELAEIAPNGALRKWRFLEEVMEAFSAELQGESRAELRFLLSLYDTQQQRIGELEGINAALISSSRLTREIAEAAEARASRAEQALNQRLAMEKAMYSEWSAALTDAGFPAEEPDEDGGEAWPVSLKSRIDQLAAALSTERERVIQECAAVCESLNTGNHWQNDMTRTVCAKAIRALSSLPTPPQQEQKCKLCAKESAVPYGYGLGASCLKKAIGAYLYEQPVPALPTPPEEEKA